MSHLLRQAILSQFEAKCRPKATTTTKQPSQRSSGDNANDADAESDVDEFEDDDDDELDDENHEALEELREDLDAEEDACIEEESGTRPEVLGLTDEEVHEGVSALTKVRCVLCIQKAHLTTIV